MIHKNSTKYASQELPSLVSVHEVSIWLNTSKKAVYAMISRRQLPAPIKIGRRVLFERSKLLEWLHEKCALSLKE